MIVILIIMLIIDNKNTAVKDANIKNIIIAVPTEYQQ